MQGDQKPERRINMSHADSMVRACSLPPKINWFYQDEQGKPVCTFHPEVLSLIEVKSPEGKKIEEQVELELKFSDSQSQDVTLPLSEIDQIDWFKVNKRCILSEQYRNAKMFIGNVIRRGLLNAPTKVRYRFDKLGIERIDDYILFVAGDQVVTSRSLTPEFAPKWEAPQLPFKLDIDPSISPQEAFAGMTELIQLSFEIGKVLVAHVISGITRAAFKVAGFVPCGVLVIVGESGMLKSHYVPYMTQLYNRKDGIGAVTRFNSTLRFIEDVLYEYSECTAVIDDLHTAEARSIARANEANAEEIIRRVSDNIGRGHKEGNALVQRDFRGNVVFIGEYSIGKESTIPRALVVKLTERPNGRVLDDYQRHQPLLVSTFYYYFIKWYVDHFDTICHVIDERLTKFRETSCCCSIHDRLRDTQFYLQTAYMIFLEFCKDSKFIRDEDAKDGYKAFTLQLVDLIESQQARFMSRKGSSDSVNYFELIRTLFKNKNFRLTDSVKKFKADKYDGIIHYDCLCLRGESLDNKIRNIFSNYERKDAINALIAKGALKRGTDKNTVQIQGLKGLRFYAIRLSKLKEG